MSKKLFYQCQGILFSLGKVVIDNDLVELIGEGQFKLCTGDALVDDFWRIRATTLQTTTQLCNRRWLDEDAQRLVAIIVLDVHATLHIDIEYHILSSL